MLPEELMGGGGGGGLPPELMAALGGGGAPPEAAPPGGGGGGGNVDHLVQALEHIMGYVDGEDDEVHIQTALQCLANLQKILAEEQKQGDDLLQGKATPRALRRAAGGAAGGY